MPLPPGIQELPPFIHNHSPLGMIGAFTIVLRERFDPLQHLPWCWTGDPNTSTVYIYAMFDKAASESTDLVPRIIIRKGPTAHKRVSIGDLDQYQPGLLSKGATYYYQQADVSIGIECIGKTLGESAMIADIAQMAISGGQKIIERDFNIRSVSPLLVQTTRRWEEDDTKFLTEVQFRANIENRWFVAPGAEIIERYNAKLSLYEAAFQLLEGCIDPQDP